VTDRRAAIDGGIRTGGAALGAAVLAVVAPRADPADPATLVGLVLLVVAVVAWLTAPSVRRAAALAVPAAAALVAVGVGTPTTATLVEQDLATGFLPLALAMSSAILIQSPWLVAGTAAGGLVAGPVRMLVYDPFLDPGCPGCAPGKLVVWPAPELAAVLHPLGLLIAFLAVLVAAATQRTRVELFGVLLCLLGYAVDIGRHESVVVSGALAACWLARTAAADRQRSGRARRLLRSLEDGDDLTTVLRRDLGDRSLLVGFPDGDDLVDCAGTIIPSGRDGIVTTELVVEGALVARVHHAPTTRVPDLAAGLDDPASLALANEQLTAQLAARVRDLTRARALVVEAGVRDRRSLERDLHDGVQQDLLALGLDLRVAAAEMADNDPRRRALDDAVGEVHAALDEVRDISHGVYPPLLATRGLAAATASLARRTSATVEVGRLPDGRLTDAVERAAFAVVAEAVDRGASYVEARLTDGQLLIRASETGPGVDGILPDVVAAVGGELHLGPGTMTAVIPCG